MLKFKTFLTEKTDERKYKNKSDYTLLLHHHMDDDKKKRRAHGEMIRRAMKAGKHSPPEIGHIHPKKLKKDVEKYLKKKPK
jgi:hypothetical protein